MARIYQRPGKNGSIWYVDYLVDGHRVRKRCGKNKRLADLALADIQVKIERKELGFERKDRSVETFLKEYMDFAKANKAEKTFERDLQTFKHFERLVPTDRLTGITAPKLEAYKTKRKAEGAKSSTVNRELNTIKAMLRKAVEWGYLHKNPGEGVRKFKEQKRQVRYLGPDEIRKLLDESSGRLKNIIATLLYTGLRRDELIHLEWDDIDLGKKLVSVQPKQGWHPKDYEVRHIPMSDTLTHILEDHKGRGSGLVFSTGLGTALNGNVLSRDFRKLAKHCGIKGASIHTLRHTFASYLAMNGVDLYTIQKLLGHSSIKTTEIYAHLAPDYLRSAITKLNFKLPPKPQAQPALS